MGVDHGGGHIAVAQQLLHSANVGTGLQQVGGKAVAQGVHGHRLVDLGDLDRVLQGSLQALFIEVMTPFNARAGVNRQRW